MNETLRGSEFKPRELVNSAFTHEVVLMLSSIPTLGLPFITLQTLVFLFTSYVQQQVVRPLHTVPMTTGIRTMCVCVCGVYVRR